METVDCAFFVSRANNTQKRKAEWEKNNNNTKMYVNARKKCHKLKLIKTNKINIHKMIVSISVRRRWGYYLVDTLLTPRFVGHG